MSDLRAQSGPYAIGSYMPPPGLPFRCPDCVTQDVFPCPHQEAMTERPFFMMGRAREKPR